MYTGVSEKIVNIIIKSELVNESKKEIYVYGIEVLISTIVYMIIFTIIGIVSNTLLYSYVFFLGFYIIRSGCGGVHAKTYYMCHMAFALNHILFIIFHYYFSQSAKEIFTAIIPIYTVISTFIFAPVDNNSKKFTPKEYVYFKTKSRIIAVIIFFVFEILYFMKIDNSLIYSCLFGVFSAITSMILAYYMQKYNIKKTKRRDTDEKNKGFII